MVLDGKNKPSSETVMEIDETTTESKPRLLSYNNCIKSYDLTLLTPNKITVNHLLTISPIFADVSDAFGHILLHPDIALSCQIFLYKSTEDGKPTLDLTKAEVNENNEPIMFPLVYSHSSFGTKDLPMIFGYAMTQCVRFFREFSDTPLKMGEFKDPVLAEKANLTRLNLVEKILCAAYVDDLSCHEFFLSLVSYFIDAYSSEERLKVMETKFPFVKNPKKMIWSVEDFIKGVSILSSIDFDIFLKEFAQFMNIQISQDVSHVPEFCGFYLKSWESLDKDHTKALNIGLPKENISDETVRSRPIIADTHKEISRLQKTIEDDSLIHSEDDGLPSVTQLGRTLKQWKYKIKGG